MAVEILLSAGANPNFVDAMGRRPADLIVVAHKKSNGKAALEELVGTSDGAARDNHRQGLWLSTCSSNSNYPSLSSSAEDQASPSSDSSSSPINVKFRELPSLPEKKEYPVDPSLPVIKNGMYATDEFRMFSLKVRPSS